MKKHLTSEMDLTRGNLFKKVFQFTLPLMMTSIFQLLYTTVDLWTVTEFGGGSLSMSSIGSNSALINLIITMLLSLSLGSSVTISIAKGSNDKQRAENILHTSYIIAIVGGVAFAILGYFLAPVILVAMDTPASIVEKATIYLKIYFLGTPFLALVNFASQMLRSLGDSKRPLIFLTISGAINVLFDLFFVIVLKMDVAGVAVATVISWIIADILLTLWFMKSTTVFANFSFKKLKVSKRELIDILKIGIPAGLQGVAFCLPNLLIQSSLYTIKDYIVDGTYINPDEIVVGASASAQLEGYMFVMIDSFCIANVSFTGQNFGALNKKNIIKSYWYCFIWMMIAWLFCFIIAMTCYNGLLSIFITDTDENVIREHAITAGYQRLLILASTYALDGWMDLNGSYLKGMKKSLPPAIVTIIGCTGTRILFLLFVFTMPYFHTVFWLYAAFPISWTLVNIVYLPLVLIIQKKQFKLIDNKIATTITA